MPHNTPYRGDKVQGKCPSCGLETLYLGAGGYVTCGLIGCRSPDAASRLLERSQDLLDLQAMREALGPMLGLGLPK